jgi:septum formation protein
VLKIILSSSSIYRKELMERLCIPFEIVHPEINEAMRPHEKPHTLVTRLSEEKAYAHSSCYQSHLIIGSDQIAYINDEPSSDSNNLNIFSSSASIKVINPVIIAKPKNKKAAFDQLKLQSGKKVIFLTSVSVLNTSSSEIETNVVATNVIFRTLSEEEINDYLNYETPYDCAGSLKSEGLGIRLLDAVYSSDPTALVGLPLIQLSKMLRSNKYKTH